MISINSLLSTCVDACSRGCNVIRYVNEKRKEPSNNNNNNDNQINVVYKVDNDPRSALTEADLASQRVILYCLRQEWGTELNIIGEEDPDDNDGNGDNDGDNKNGATNDQEDSDEAVFKKYNIPLPKDTPIDHDLCSTDHSSSSTSTVNHDDDIMVSVSDLTLYIDPMDGTREFVENRLQNVQCLIGITHKGQPIAGVIGLPFVQDTNTTKDISSSGGVFVVSGLNWGSSSFVKTMYVNGNNHSEKEEGIINHEDLFLSFGCNSTNNSVDETATATTNDASSILNIFTGDSSKIQKKHALKYLEEFIQNESSSSSSSSNSSSTPASSDTTIKSSNNNATLNMHIIGGCGNKILRTIATGLSNNDGNAMSVITPGTCSWDTAAPTAILFAILAQYGGEKQGKVTDLFGGELVYSPTGKKVDNDLGALVSIGPMACRYHDQLCKRLRNDDLILSSTLKPYWVAQSKEDMDMGNLASLRSAQQDPQAIGIVRNKQGYFMKCVELQAMISEQIISCDDSVVLLGYSIPEGEVVMVRNGEIHGNRIDKCIIHLFWKKNEVENHGDVAIASKLPDSVVYEKVYSDESTYIVRLTKD